MNTALQKHQQPYKNITLCLFWPLNIPTRKHTLVFFRPMNQPVDLDISTVSIFNKTLINLVGSSEIVQSQFSVLSYQIYLRHQTKQEQKLIPNKIIRQLLPHYWRVISFLPRNASKSPPYGAEQTKSSLSRPPNRDPENKQISEIHLQHESSSSPGGLLVKTMDVYFHSGRNHLPTHTDRMHTWIYMVDYHTSLSPRNIIFGFFISWNPQEPRYFTSHQADSWAQIQILPVRSDKKVVSVLKVACPSEPVIVHPFNFGNEFQIQDQLHCY